MASMSANCELCRDYSHAHGCSVCGAVHPNNSHVEINGTMYFLCITHRLSFEQRTAARAAGSR